MEKHEKNIDAEIKKKHEEFDRDIETYLNQFRSRGSAMTNISPAIQQLRQRAMVARRPTRRPGGNGGMPL